MTAIGARNRRQWLAGRQVCTAPQSGQRQRLTQTASGNRRSSGAQIHGPTAVFRRSVDSSPAAATGRASPGS